MMDVVHFFLFVRSFLSFVFEKIKKKSDTIKNKKKIVKEATTRLILHKTNKKKKTF